MRHPCRIDAASFGESTRVTREQGICSKSPPKGNVYVFMYIYICLYLLGIYICIYLHCTYTVYSRRVYCLPRMMIRYTAYQYSQPFINPPTARLEKGYQPQCSFDRVSYQNTFNYFICGRVTMGRGGYGRSFVLVGSPL